MLDADPPSTPDLRADLDLIREAALEAGAVALSYFRCNPEVWYKNEGRSPVTVADIAVDDLLRKRLLAARPEYGWFSEESETAPDAWRRETLFVVDPIDGTRGFVAGRDIWCVSIAVVHRMRSVAGVLVAPATGEVFAACEGGQAEKNGAPIAVQASDGMPGEKLAIAAPDRLMARLPDDLRRMVTRVGHIPSLAYRLAMVADGRLHATLVRESANDWDIAAADIILRSAGGELVQHTGAPVAYDRQGLPHGVLVAGSGSVLARLTEAMGDIPAH
ncbi:MAG TPA: 3'(2'),5'-bisphosphate nucleotidase CysQ [Pararhizobium sp.]|nr:3'(2'),5'-bisphosphate nucleotidase CysQ [Pararhizobium sp.]